MPVSSGGTVFPRPVSVALLMTTAVLFASNHIAARIAFDDQTGVLLAVISRSGFAFLAMTAVVLLQRQNLSIPRPLWHWQAAIGFLIAIQSLCIYSAVARIPVAMALLAVNIFPLMYVAINWVLSGRRPRPVTLLVMFGILLGLVLVLDLSGKLSGGASFTKEWAEGLMFAGGAAFSFALSLWVTEQKLRTVKPVVRTWYMIAIVFTCMVLSGVLDVIPGGMAMPVSWTGWTGLLFLAMFYTIGFAMLYLNFDRLDMGRNSTVMNFEPVASLVLAWIVLGQAFGALQLGGAAIVIGGILLLARMRA